MVRSMMSHTILPDLLWGFAHQSAALILNRSPTKATDKTPYEIWKGRVPDLSFIRVWGCEAYVKWRPDDKLGPRSVKTYFVGYPKGIFGHYFYSPIEQRVFVAAPAKFLEKEFLSNKQSSRTFELSEVKEPSTEHVMEEDVPSTSTAVTIPPEPRRSGRVSLPRDRYIGMVEESGREDLLLLDSNEPASYNGAMTVSDSKLWLEAMNPR
ncbi:hypothetical protein vseg_013311 [Gypsophila vaccaria]